MTFNELIIEWKLRGFDIKTESLYHMEIYGGGKLKIGLMTVKNRPRWCMAKIIYRKVSKNQLALIHACTGSISYNIEKLPITFRTKSLTLTQLRKEMM